MARTNTQLRSTPAVREYVARLVWTPKRKYAQALIRYRAGRGDKPTRPAELPADVAAKVRTKVERLMARAS